MSEKSMRSTRLGGVLQNDIAVREGGIFDLQSWRFYCFFCSKTLVFVAFSSLVVRLNFKLPRCSKLTPTERVAPDCRTARSAAGQRIAIWQS